MYLVLVLFILSCIGVNHSPPLDEYSQPIIKVYLIERPSLTTRRCQVVPGWSRNRFYVPDEVCHTKLSSRRPPSLVTRQLPSVFVPVTATTPTVYLSSNVAYKSSMEQKGCTGRIWRVQIENQTHSKPYRKIHSVNGFLLTES